MMLLFFVAFCAISLANGLKCYTNVHLRTDDWQRYKFGPFERFVSDRQTDGIDGYCDSSSNTNPVCSAVIAKGRISIHGSKRDAYPNDVEGTVSELAYYSCDYGLVVRRDPYWVGWICRALEGEFSRTFPGNWYNRESLCYHWNNIRNVQFGTPDVSVPGETLAGYKMTLLEGSLTIHCCRYKDKCNEFLYSEAQCETRMPFPFDHGY